VPLTATPHEEASREQREQLIRDLVKLVAVQFQAIAELRQALQRGDAPPPMDGAAIEEVLALFRDPESGSVGRGPVGDDMASLRGWLQGDLKQ
jgi:hypothetical protein